MPKKAKYDSIRCNHFMWRLSRRKGVWYADGRTNPINVGRHSLGTRDKTEALNLLAQLDETRAVKFGLIPQKEKLSSVREELAIAEARRLYEEFISRPVIIGGVKPTTKKRYGDAFNKFVPWTTTQGLTQVRQIDLHILRHYASYLEGRNYAPKTLLNELTTLKQWIRWLIEDGHLKDGEPIKLKLSRPESQRAYCYRPVEVAAMIERCRAVSGLKWLEHAIVALATTGMRIGELVALKWSDLDFESGNILLAEESGRRRGNGGSLRSLKSNRSRSFPIHPKLLAVLQATPKIDEFVLHGPRQGRLKANTVRDILVRDVLTPLADSFPAVRDGLQFQDGRLHSFRHYFVSQCAASNVPERIVMEWVGHADSAMVRHYFHLHDEESKRQMQSLDLLGESVGRSDGAVLKNSKEEEATPNRQGS